MLKQLLANYKILIRKIKSALKLYISFFEVNFNKKIITRSEYNKTIEKKFFPKTEKYWDAVATEILKAAHLDDGKHFFLNKIVQMHLASENNFLGYRLLHKVREHTKGEELLNKCKSSAWGAPFMLKRYPYVTPSAIGHIANLLSIYDEFGKELNQYKSFLDFGGGFGGLASCLCQISNKVSFTIVDLPQMIEVQKKYLISTTTFNERIFFSNDCNELNSRYDVFNASFSFSEIPLESRVSVEYFIIKKCDTAHIIFNKNFNDIDNVIYMNDFATKLITKGWQVSIKPYHWFGWETCMLMSATSSSSPNLRR